MEIYTKSAEATQKLGTKIGDNLKGGEILALSGNLGSGKTTFVQGIARAFKIEKIISPTFILMRKYKVNRTSKIRYLYHMDLYRLEGNMQKELENLGFFEILQNKNNVVVIEWAEKAHDILPKNTRWISFEHIDEDQRLIKSE